VSNLQTRVAKLELGQEPRRRRVILSYERDNPASVAAYEAKKAALEGDVDLVTLVIVRDPGPTLEPDAGSATTSKAALG